jgi:nucleoside-diphosphate-sugar epimerase
MPLPWAFASDVARVSLGALERGEVGRRYLALGRPEDTCSLPAFCNRFLDLAGIQRCVEEFDPSAPGAAADPEFGSMVTLLQAEYPVPSHDPSVTNEALGVEPTALDEGLRQTLEFLRRLGKL